MMDIRQCLQRFPVQSADIAGDRVLYREAGAATQVTHVLLHGIGSASASWVYQLSAAERSPQHRVLAWDAPGYGLSTPLPMATPHAGDYAARLWTWLDALQVQGSVCLVGHSLGALMAARAACLQPARVARLVLLSPARGYGDATAAERERILQTRLDNLTRLGPVGMAAARAAAMLSTQARPEWIDAVRETMAQINPAGYTQAARMLAVGRLIDDVRALTLPVQVASGEVDAITPPDACDSVAQAAGQTRIRFDAVGHACALEAAAQVNTLLMLPQVSEEMETP
jgi:pimeloyl-ACP methyl ester carboxylesterase